MFVYVMLVEGFLRAEYGATRVAVITQRVLVVLVFLVLVQALVGGKLALAV
jgi:hypothetical protein